MTSFRISTLAPQEFSPRHTSDEELDLRDPDAVGAQCCRRGVLWAGIALALRSFGHGPAGTVHLLEVGVLAAGALLLISVGGLVSRRVRGLIGRTAQRSARPLTLPSMILRVLAAPLLFIGLIGCLIALAVALPSAPGSLGTVPVGVVAAVGVAVAAAGVALSSRNRVPDGRPAR